MWVFALAPGTIETVASHIETHTLVWLIVGAALGPVIGIVLAALFGIRWVLPVYKAEQEAGRMQRAEEAEKTRTHYTETATQRNELHDSQNLRIVEQVSGRLDRLHEKTDRVLSHTSALIAKLGAPIIVLGLIFLASLFALSLRHVVLLAARCDPPCPEGQKCETAIPRKCVEDKKGKEAVKAQASKPQSVLSFDRFAGYVSSICDRRRDPGCG